MRSTTNSAGRYLNTPTYIHLVFTNWRSILQRERCYLDTVLHAHGAHGVLHKRRSPVRLSLLFVRRLLKGNSLAGDVHSPAGAFALGPACEMPLCTNGVLDGAARQA